MSTPSNDAPQLACYACGAQSSGNRYLVSVLLRWGCSGVSGHDQPFDGPGDAIVVPPGTRGPIALHRSYPHRGRYPDLAADCGALRRSGYEPAVVVLVRDPACCELSHVAAGHAASADEARGQIAGAYPRIFAGLAACRARHVVLPYPSLARPATLRWLADWLGLPFAEPPPWRDGDAKYGP